VNGKEDSALLQAPFVTLGLIFRNTQTNDSTRETIYRFEQIRSWAPPVFTSVPYKTCLGTVQRDSETQ